MIFNDKYIKEGDPIGKGFSGIIYKVLDKQTKNPYALKFIPIVIMMNFKNMNQKQM